VVVSISQDSLPIVVAVVVGSASASSLFFTDSVLAATQRQRQDFSALSLFSILLHSIGKFESFSSFKKNCRDWCYYCYCLSVRSDAITTLPFSLLFLGGRRFAVANSELVHGDSRTGLDTDHSASRRRSGT
jgi:hypothetical protein